MYKILINMEKNQYWKRKYNNYFKEIKKEYLILNGNYDWKREYLRVKKFNYWSEMEENRIHLDFSNLGIREIPKEIGNLIKLRDLDCPYNKIKEIPKEIGNLINLRSLDLSFNNIKVIPEEVTKLDNLEYLLLIDNKITEIPKEINKLKKLKGLDFTYNKIKEIPEEINNLNNLEYLNLSNNGMSKIPIKFFKSGCLFLMINKEI